MVISKINTGLTLEYLKNAPESLYFDRKKLRFQFKIWLMK